MPLMYSLNCTIPEHSFHAQRRKEQSDVSTTCVGEDERGVIRRYKAGAGYSAHKRIAPSHHTHRNKPNMAVPLKVGLETLSELVDCARHVACGSAAYARAAHT
jgi:hypothetical protein